jgi:hypothetical protein
MGRSSKHETWFIKDIYVCRGFWDGLMADGLRRWLLAQEDFPPY